MILTHDLSTRILFEDGEALVIDKPGGLPIKRPRAGGRSLEDYLEELKLGFQRPPVPVHRIDTDTSGCLLLARNPKALKRFAAEGGNQVTLVPSLDTSSGQVLRMEIINAESAGNAWIGHRKSVTVKGWLYKDGQQSAKFVARRNSSGGMGAGFKGSCDVLERSVNAIGKDVAAWLQNPVDGAQLGDLR